MMVPTAGTTENDATGSRLGGNVPAGGMSWTMTVRLLIVLRTSPSIGVAVIVSVAADGGRNAGGAGAVTTIRARPWASVVDCWADGSTSTPVDAETCQLSAKLGTGAPCSLRTVAMTSACETPSWASRSGVAVTEMDRPYSDGPC